MRMKTSENPHEMGIGGGKGPTPGRYHVVVRSVDDSHGKHATSIPVDFGVLAGSVPGQEEKTTMEFFYYDPKDPKDWAIDRLARFAWACGLIDKDEEKDIDLKQAVGKQLCVELVEETYEKDGKQRKTVKIAKDGGMWPVNDDAVKDIPKNTEALALLSQPRAAAAVTGSPQPATAAAASGGDDPFAGL